MVRIRGLYGMIRLRISWGKWWWWNERIVGRGKVEGIVHVVEMAIVVVYAGRIAPRQSTRMVMLCRGEPSSSSRPGLSLEAHDYFPNLDTALWQVSISTRLLNEWISHLWHDR